MEKLHSMIQQRANGYVTFKDVQVSKVKSGSGGLSSATEGGSPSVMRGLKKI